jgi:alpha-L-fucosidase
MADGTIPQPSVERLLAIGEWLQVNGEAVYGTEPGPIQGESWCRSTVKGDKTFLHVFEWPSDGKIEITCPGLNVTHATLLADPSGSVLPVTNNAGHVEVVGPASAPDPSDTVVVLVNERE